MKKYIEIYKHDGFRAVIRALITGIHIQLIRFVSGYRPIIMDVNFIGGIQLGGANKGAYIVNNTFNFIPK